MRWSAGLGTTLKRLTRWAGWWRRSSAAYPQREIAEAAYKYQMAVDRKEKIIVGVNDYVAEEKGIEILQIDETVAERQAVRLRKLRAERSKDEVERRLDALRKAAAGDDESDAAYLRCGEGVCDAG